MLQEPIKHVQHRERRADRHTIGEPLNCGTVSFCEPRDDRHPQDIEWFITEALPAIMNPPDYISCGGCNRKIPRPSKYKTCDKCRARNQARYYRLKEAV